MLVAMSTYVFDQAWQKELDRGPAHVVVEPYAGEISRVHPDQPVGAPR
jgi:hypothetical protein